LFLATRDEALLQAAGLIDLWSSGYVEPIEPPPAPYHILAQQLMALILQEKGVAGQTWLEWVRKVPAFAQMPAERIAAVVEWMLEQDLLWDEEGILGIGRAGEKTYGRRNFMELLCVFLSPPLFGVLHGRQEIGFVDELTFLGKHDGPRVLLLGGRAWQVTHVDWQRKIAYVEAAEVRGRSRWKGEGRGLRFRLCQAIKAILTGDDARPWWSKRAREQLAQIRNEFAWLTPGGTVVLATGDTQAVWWTFAGLGGNASLAAALAETTQSRVTHECFCLTFEQRFGLTEIEQAISGLRKRDVSDFVPTVDEEALRGLKFSDCLPVELALQVLRIRLRENAGVEHALRLPPRFIVQ
jgi:ATP-dependent Lhr-like helicase